MKHSILAKAKVTILLLGAVLQGCASLSNQGTTNIPPPQPVSETEILEEPSVIGVYDPLEPFNRLVYIFNAQFDEYVFLPVVNAYEFITPDLIEKGISNFFANIGAITNFTNTLLQLKFLRAAKTATRFLINSTVGIAGVWDPAARLGLFPHQEDFGQTLGYYGLGPGPYIVLPIAGPSNLRDTTGLAVDSLPFSAITIIPFNFGNNIEFTIPFYSLRAINQRHRTSFRYYETGSPFEYGLIRLLYTKMREAAIAR